MIYTLMLVVFVLGYAAIAFEHQLKIDKAAAALITGVLTWTLYVLASNNIHEVEGQLLHHLSEISSILFFLIGAMTIVELVDAHEGFAVITDKIKTTNKVKLMWIIGILSFFFSAALDNLTTSIVMVSLLRKLIEDKKQRWFFAGMVVVAANAGGAWSPIGDVTTTMLWIKGQISAGAVIQSLIVPSLATLLAPLAILSFRLKGNVERPMKSENAEHYTDPTTPFERNFVFFAGVAGLIFVPVFKTVTHLPPFMGMMLSLGVLWIITDILHRRKPSEIRHHLSPIGVLQKIDTPSVLFFLGILLAVASLQSMGQLGDLANALDHSIGTDTQNGVYVVGLIIGLLSAIVDNVPLVAAAMGMYEVTETGLFMQDGTFWQFLAYCAGTGGSALIIGSAAGVAVMGLEKIPFGWYVKNITLLALVGYIAGAGVYILQNMLF
ncbi:MAG: sodium:proton antiporter NhaD [Flavobacteriales bacterium]|jgi:Na+/H+ antiporter NhaD/arsenite permease-like protein|uniref:Transport protein, CitMHS family n=1 Tax=uncultured Flavobacteriia bacterium TaxID=212695 RepID=F4MLK8_9BACT|nr:Na+/H+ antiporter NhaD [uncultured bacterium]CBL80569.1 transport protein, CitMHS family [uncultured Flavobacteriia bacterium]CBL87138.1 transport protein, CitMHS family [uncultured Flavobacteriia bacterium]|tara:strand:- start:2060 stop:3370 length:1311 start_codon:yes stop_codon:yes gene_type:complete